MLSNLTADHDHDHEHAHQSGETSGILQQIAHFFLINIDPILSIIVSFIYIVYFVKTTKEASLIFSQAVPSFINIAKIKSDLKALVHIK
jgi:Co/Zn/Cd efflux system component